MVDRHFFGDDQAQRDYLAQLGRWNYEQMADCANSVGLATRHPGSPSDFMSRRLQLNLFNPYLADINFNDFLFKTLEG